MKEYHVLVFGQEIILHGKYELNWAIAMHKKNKKALKTTINRHGTETKRRDLKHKDFVPIGKMKPV